MKEFKEVKSKISTVNNIKLQSDLKPKTAENKVLNKIPTKQNQHGLEYTELYNKNLSSNILKQSEDVPSNYVNNNYYNNSTHVDIANFKNHFSKQQINHKIPNQSQEESISNLVNNPSNKNNNDEYQIFSAKDYVIHNINYENNHHSPIKNPKKQIVKQNTLSKIQNNNNINLPKIENNNRIRNNKSQGKLNIKKQNQISQREKVNLKGKTPTIEEKGIILPKNNVNFIQENKEKIKIDMVPSRAKLIETKEEDQFEHKNYGKIPD